MKVSASVSRQIQRLSRLFVFSMLPFCQGDCGSQNEVRAPSSARRCGQSTNSVPRSKVTERRALMGRGRSARAICAMMGLVRFSGLRRTTTNRLRRSTIVVTLAGPNFRRKWT